MIAINNINKGLYLSVDPSRQPEGTVIRNHNGQFLHYDDGNFMWKGSSGTEAITTTIYQDQDVFSDLHLTIMGMTEMNGDVIVISTREETGFDYIGRLVFSDGDLKTAVYYQIIPGADLELDVNNPLRQFFAVYENENTQRVYWNDGVKSPRSLNIASVPSPIDVELLNFTPPSDVGEISYRDEITGSLKCGTYTFVFRLTTDDGAVTDYSMPTSPISVNKKRASSNLSDYNQLENQGGNFTETSEVGLTLKVENIDTRYDNIQVISFRSIGKDVYEPGVLIFDQDISSTSMIFYYRGGENLGTVTEDEVNITTKFIIQAQLMEFIRNINSLADYKERTELEEGTKIKYNKIIGATLDKEMYRIPLDTRTLIDNYNRNDDSLEEKPLASVNYYPNIRYKDLWYRQGATGSFVLGDGTTARQSTDIPYIRIKKYTEAGGTIVYKDINLQNDYLNYRSKKISEVLKGYMGTETYRIGILFWKDGKPYGVRYLGDKELPVRSGYWEMATRYASGGENYLMGNILSIIINNIDLTELVTVNGSGDAIDCKIDGFSIVRCVRDEQVISQGILTPMLVSSTRSILPSPSIYHASEDRRKYAYTYYSPDVLFNAPGKEIMVGDKLKIHAYLGLTFADNNFYGPLQVDANNWAQKYYTDQDRPSTNLPLDGEENTLRGVYDLPFNPEGTNDLSIPELGISVRNESETPGGKDGYGIDTKVLITETDEASDSESYAVWEHNAVSIVDHYKPKTNLYGGTSDAALAANVYYGTGHYQEVTLDILNSIKSAGKFEFNGVQIFGGDTFLTLFDLQRVIRNQFKDSADFFSHTMLFPIQTTVNTEMRTGNHIARKRSYHSSKNPDGIGLEGSYIKLEDFNYNDAYSTSLSNRFYLPLPFGFKQVSESKFNILWSNTKTPGEKIDNYRIFPVNNVKPIEQSFGFITGLINGNNKLIYLQKKGIGYIPIDERVTINSVENQPVQLGVGGKFTRYDTTEKFYGCQHYFSICKIPGGIVWFDFNRRSFIYMSENMQLSDESIIKGLEPFFSSIDAGLKNHDNPFSGYGIYTYYDSKRKEVVMIFRNTSDNNIAITFNSKSGTFTGTLDLIPSIVYSGLDYPLMSKRGNYNVWVSNNNNRRSFFGTAYDSFLKFIVNNNSNDNKIFDNFSVIGNENFFNSITFKGKNFEVTENILDNNGNILSDYIKYLNFEWRGSYPLDSEGGRLRGHYAEIEFKIDKDNTTDPQLLNMKTINRKTE